jgi:carboxyl-terminal processing protease
MRTVLKFLALFVLMVLLIVGTFAGGFYTSGILFQPKPNQVNDGAPAEFRDSMPVFWEAWNIIQSDFYKQPLDPTTMTYGAISGMVDALGDPHTAFVDPQIAKRINEDLSGSFEGIGATVEMNGGRLTIVAPIKDTPAFKAGLKAGDVVLKVNDTVIQNMTVDEAIALIRGPKGSTVTLTIQRGSQPAFTVNIVRDTIAIPEVESRMLDNNIAYVRLNEFSATAPDDLRAALQQLLAQHPKALIFDLRNNPGGFLDAAVKIASEFIKQGNVVLIEKFKNGDQQEYKTDSGGVATDIPMVLLVNEGSASASEILSGALKDYKRATIIGTTTYGKGSVQTPHQLSDGSQLRVTIAHFFSPQDHEIDGVGITPDIQVPDPTDAQTLQGQDPQLDRAVQFANGGAHLDLGEWLWSLFFRPAVVLPS